jgi:hypothetical protein
MVVYAPGTLEKDPQKQNMALQEHARQIDVSTASIAANTANIAAIQSVITNLGAPLTNTLVADVLLNNTANYFDGPSVAQGAVGTWFASATVTLFDTATATMFLKLWDGTNVASSSVCVVLSTQTISVFTLSGIFMSPPGNIRLSARDSTNTSGKILFNQSGLAKDSSITVVRLA